MTDKEPAAEPTFEEALADLARVIQTLERGQPTLEESLSEFERGIHLLRICREKLDAADRRILELVDIDDQGRATLKPFVHQATAEKEKKEAPAGPTKGKKKKEVEPPATEPDLFG